MTRAELNTHIDTNITNKTAVNSLTPTNEGNALKEVADYIDQEILTVAPAAKTAGLVEADDNSPYQVLSFDLNNVSTGGVSDKVVLPTTTIIGKEVFVFALNNASSFTVRGNQDGTSVLSSGGVATTAGTISVGPNISVRFLHLGNGFWKASVI